MSWSTPPAFAAGMTAGLAAALQKLSDDLAVIGGARTAYTPTWTQSTTNPTLGNGVLLGEFRRVDKEVDFLIQLTIGSGTILGTGTFLFALPATAKRISWSAFGSVLDVSASTTIGIPIAAEATSTTLVGIRQWPAGAGGQYQVVNQTQPIAWGTGDVLTVSGRYEAA